MFKDKKTNLKLEPPKKFPFTKIIELLYETNEVEVYFTDNFFETHIDFKKFFKKYRKHLEENGFKDMGNIDEKYDLPKGVHATPDRNRKSYVRKINQYISRVELDETQGQGLSYTLNLEFQRKLYNVPRKNLLFGHDGNLSNNRVEVSLNFFQEI